MRSAILKAMYVLCAFGTYTLLPVQAHAAATHAAVQQNPCPPNAHPYSETGNSLQCVCNDGFTLYNNKCQLKVAVEDQLQQRLLATLRGVRSTTQAIEAARSEIVWKQLRDHFKKIDASIGAALLARNPVLLAPEALEIAVDLGAALGEWRACTATGELQTACDNLHNFQRILHETADELIRMRKKR